MPTIAVSGFSASTKTPRMYFAVVLGGPGTSAGVAQKTILLYGNLIASNITAGGFTVLAGTAQVAQVVQVPDALTASNLFGAGSELHLMCSAAFKVSKLATVFAIPVAESGGAAASAVLTLVGNATSAHTITFTIANRTVAVPVGATDNITTVAANCALAINNAGVVAAAGASAGGWEMPVTATSSIGVLTILFKHKGTKGNWCPIRTVFSNSSTSSQIIGSTGGLTQTFGGTAYTYTVAVAAGNVLHLGGGTTPDSLTNALAAVSSTAYDRHVLSQVDSANAVLLSTQLNTMAAVATDIWQQGIVANADTYANGVTFSTAVNASRMQVAWHMNAENLPCEIAAQVAAARLFGDSAAGGNTIGEATDPAANLNGLMLVSIAQQYAVGDRPSPATIENALNSGLTVLSPTPANPGFVGVVASITSRFLDANVLPNYAVWKTKIVTVSDYVANDLRTDLATTYAGYKLKPNTADGSPIKIAMTATPNDVKGRIFAKLKNYEENGILMNVDAHLQELAVMLDPAWPSRILADIPEVPIADFDQVAANIRQLSF